jgi:two-component system response regulator YesN
MIKLLIVDDEPLVLVGIMSMLNWSGMGIEVCGTAMNGDQALQLIGQHHPELVITDIKMPVLNGLEMIKACKERFTDVPQFIILTSYEEFPLIKEAMKHQVVDYLIKLELNAQMLAESVGKAMARISQSRMKPDGMVEWSPYLFYEKFMIRLLNNLFESEEQFQLQARDLKLDFTAPAYVLCLCTITGIENEQLPQDKLMNLCFSAIQMVGGIAPKYLPCYTATLDLKHFCLIFCIPDPSSYHDAIRKALDETFKMVNYYFNVRICSAVGRSCTNPLLLCESYQDARQIQIYSTSDRPVVFYDDFNSDTKNFGSSTFNLSLFKTEIQKAFETFDADAFCSALDSIVTLFRGNPTRHLQAIDASCNLLYLSISLLPDGENVLSGIFEAYPDSYRSIYKYTHIDQIINWLEVFRDGLARVLRSQHKNYKNHIIRNIQSYIDTHVEEKLSLNDVASLFSISPSYLSILFKKATDIGFTEYVTQKKISRAKAWISEGQMKIYEIADRLGFESAFYFSKVFKKVVGCSPREYMQGK